ncbi:hypothetical protein CIB48_g10921 [Xylaria polymorpha]|nr:hypothetical protein CIB48_g10921 [Xylaria polymorpha]
MSTAEDQELKDKINKLASRISRHKEAQHSSTNHGKTSQAISLGISHSPRENSGPDYVASNRGSYQRPAPYPPQPHRGGRGRFAHAYRNKTLVLGGAGQSGASSLENQPPDPTTPSWVTKTDRHLQLINRDVYERETQQRTEAIEKSFKQAQLNRDRREKARFFSNMQQTGRDNLTASSNSSKPASRYEVEVDGVRFHVTQQGSKLVKAPDDLNPPNATPKVALLFGVKFHRTKNGNLTRRRHQEGQRELQGLLMDWYRLPSIKRNACLTTYFYRRQCGPTCRYLHDVSKTAICRNWLVKGDCPKGDNCDLSHEITEERTPLSRHVFECPDFSNNGVCKLKGCKRPHIERASILRKSNRRASSEEMDDLSSEDEDIVDSDDVDSDEVEEFIGHNYDDMSFAEQKDFIGFA